ncbi:hypothetical protein NA8A_05618 [Nitratireductor indicus C115]|uniref:Uncharacterized protein n=1 Tax=Nitratireductor indicus C115 TaxID=1231190 RepID=K2NVW0_9HYPH|nr:hypothetical protein [Nitratireductor indicus]EKF43485.1 hypothetical protein NA8A_05618 [Nitratireductor indicus C115]SFQ06605.1 hypothetical protein SAMN05216176_101182 [Nitratireductor indicus]
MNDLDRFTSSEIHKFGLTSGLLAAVRLGHVGGTSTAADGSMLDVAGRLDSTKAKPVEKSHARGPNIIDGAATMKKARELGIGKKEETSMTYDELVKSYSEKWDVTEQEAAIRLLKQRPDLMAKSYESEESAYRQRLEEKHATMYPNG